MPPGILQQAVGAYSANTSCDLQDQSRRQDLCKIFLLKRCKTILKFTRMLREQVPALQCQIWPSVYYCAKSLLLHFFHLFKVVIIA
jgi:hypothetical protein